MIGDPTGALETRASRSTREEIRANAETYRAQLGKVLDMARTRDPGVQLDVARASSTLEHVIR